MITKKTFVLVADILKRHNATPAMIEAFCTMFAAENPRFNVATFRRASGLDPRGNPPLDAPVNPGHAEQYMEELAERRKDRS